MSKSRNTTPKFPPLHAAFLALCFLVPAPLPVVCAQPAAAVNASSKVIDPEILSQVLGQAHPWNIPGRHIVGLRDGGQALLTCDTRAGFLLETANPHSGPALYTAVMRLKPQEKFNSAVTLSMLNHTRPDKTQTSLALSVGLTAGANVLRTSFAVPGYRDIDAKTLALNFDPVSEVSLAWPEEMRATIEAQIANAPQASGSLIIARIAFDGAQARAWINGRYIGQHKLPAGFNANGTFKFSTSADVELLSLRLAPYVAQSRFEPLSLEANVNASRLKGDTVQADSLPASPDPQALAAGRTAIVAGVPFEFPRPVAQSNTQRHVDLSQSWTRFGALPGYFASSSGGFGGRWVSANRIDPSRIAMYVPTARYKALHLIAVSDGRTDSLPIVTAQFYRPDAGHPFSFSANKVPALDSSSASSSVPIKLATGRNAWLHHITIPLDPDAFSWFSDLDRIGLELTKQIHYYRAYPDPLEYSFHAGGLPSNVQVYAATLERADIDIDIVPETYGHTWTAPHQPRYTLHLTNATGRPAVVTLKIDTASSDGLDKTTRQQTLTLPPSATPVSVPITLKPTRYGLHHLNVTIDTPDSSNTFKRTFAHLHPDTREQSVWQEGRGPIFGYWGWNGSHNTPKADREIPAMAAAGAETSTANYSRQPSEIIALAEKHRFISEAAFAGHVMYINGFVSGSSDAPRWDPARPQESGKAVVEYLKKIEMPASPISRPSYVPFFAEPQMGNITTGIWPSHYGEDYKLSESEQKTYESMLARYMASASAIRKQWPNYKLLMPYGDPMNAAIFLRFSKDVAPLIDGCALDLPGFERLPEQQVNQVVLNRMYPVLNDIKKHKPDAYFLLIEGTHVSSKDIDTGQLGQAEISIRNYLNLMGYGISKFESGNSPFDCANYWGENHYGGGWMTRLPTAMPKLAYTYYAALTRNLNRCNFVKYVHTSSTSVYCQQYRHYKSGALVHPFWTIRGTRQVTLAAPPDSTVTVYDAQDNPTALKAQNGHVTFTISSSPVYVHGLTSDPVVTLAPANHSDSFPAPGTPAQKLANPGDGTWKIVAENDADYTKNKPLQIERFQANMTARTVSAPAAQGSRAMAIHLPRQEKDRGVMPFYTTLKPADEKPITIPGKGSHLGLWVHASSDWGRVVYSLRDAKGEKWISVGAKQDWNNDDIHGWSNFCFDGWRFLTFQLPANLPYDSFRAHGTSWWGSYGGDGIVDLPLALEKIHVERRPKAIIGNDLLPVSNDDVLLGDLVVQYACTQDMTAQAVRLSALRMPLPAAPDILAMKNPIAQMTETGIGPATEILGVRDPEHQYDGTRCHINFTPMPNAKTYDVWVSAYADGRGALQLGRAWTTPDQLIRGLRPDRPFWVFVTYTDHEGKTSKPSKPLQFTLKDRFGYK